MGLLDKLERGEIGSTNHSEVKALDEILDRAELLMEAIHADGPPSGVTLGFELEYQRGGRHFVESGFFGLLGLMFIGVPLAMVGMMVLALLSNPSGATPLGLICLPLLFVVAIGLMSLGKDIVSEPFQNLSDPDPVEHVVEQTWLDPVNRFIAVFLNATEEESGEQQPPELVTAFYVDGNSHVTVGTKQPHGGADSVDPGCEIVAIYAMTPKTDYHSSHSIELPYGQRLEAEEIGKTISDVMGIRLEST